MIVSSVRLLATLGDHVLAEWPSDLPQHGGRRITRVIPWRLALEMVRAEAGIDDAD